MSYWIISVPNEPNPSTTLDVLASQTSKRGLSNNNELKIPPLKVGTLDSLMSLSEELSKSDPQCEQIAKKIERSYKEIHKLDKTSGGNDAEAKKGQGASQGSSSSSSSSSNSDVPELIIHASGSPQAPRTYVETFKWDERRYNIRSLSLKALADGIVKDALKADEMLRKTLSDYAEIRQAYSAIERLESGSLLVRPLIKYINPKERDLITGGDYIDTILVVVQRARKEEFESTYESLETMAATAELARKAAHDAEHERDEKEKAEKEKEREKTKTDKEKEKDEKKQTASSSSSSSSSSTSSSSSSSGVKEDKKLPCLAVVPKSAKILCDITGEEFLLYRLVVLKPGAEHYKNLLREKRYTVRQYKHDPEEEARRELAKKELKAQKTKLYNFLIQWCTTEYSESFSRWIHLKVIRLQVESVLRYGLPTNFRAVLLEPARGKEKSLRQQLKLLYGKLAGDNANLTAALDPNEQDPSGLGEDFYPYVYLTLNLQD